MGTSPKMADAMAKKAYVKRVLEAAKHGPLQTLTAKELQLTGVPLTIYPAAVMPRARAWVRFGSEPIEVQCVIARSTPLAAGIEFEADDQRFRCWVWGNAVTVSDVDGRA